MLLSLSAVTTASFALIGIAAYFGARYTETKAPSLSPVKNSPFSSAKRGLSESPSVEKMAKGVEKIIPKLYIFQFQ